MRALIASSICLFAVLPVAQAATVQAAFVAVQAANSHGSAFTSATSPTKIAFANNSSKLVVGVGFVNFENAY